MPEHLYTMCNINVPSDTKMLHNISIWRVLRVFFRSPTRLFQIRQISKEVKLAPTSVKKYINDFLSQTLVKKTQGGVYIAYKANRSDQKFRSYKKIDMLLSIEECEVLDFIEEKCSPKAIILFGSASKGDDIETSDIDLFVQAKEKDLKLGSFEKKLARKISIFFENDLKKLSPELKNNIINGTSLRGFLELSTLQ